MSVSFIVNLSLPELPVIFSVCWSNEIEEFIPAVFELASMVKREEELRLKLLSI